MRKKGKRVILEVLIGGVSACLLASLFFYVFTSLGADRPFLFRALSIPILIPFLLTKPFWPLLWPDEYSYIYEMMAFSLISYFVAGGLIGLAHSLVRRRLFYLGLSVRRKW